MNFPRRKSKKNTMYLKSQMYEKKKELCAETTIR